MSKVNIKDVFSKNLRQLMNERLFTIAYLAECTNISRATIYNYLKGKTVPNLEQLELIAEAFGVSRYLLIVE